MTSWRDADSATLHQSTTSNKRSKEEKISRVVIFDATNTPWMISKAFLQSDRFAQKYKTYRKVTTPVTNSKGINRPSLLKKVMRHSNHNKEKKS